MGVNFSTASQLIGANREMTTTAAAAQEENETKAVKEESDSDSDDDEIELTDGEKLRMCQWSLFRYIESKDYDGLREWLRSLPEHESVYIPFKTLLHCIHTQDEQNFIRALIQISSSAITPLRRLASAGSNYPCSIAVLLELGVDPNIRVPTYYSYRYDRRELLLPLCLALRPLSNGVPTICAFHLDNAAVRLISYLCTVNMLEQLEPVRLLASKTKEIEIDQTIHNCMRHGRVADLCALMLLGYHSQVSSVSLVHFCCDDDDVSPNSKEIMEQLVDIFKRIGDKLVNYVKLQGLKRVKDDAVILDIALLLEDAGYQVTSEDILPRLRRHCFLFRAPLKMINSEREGVQIYSTVSALQDFIRGYCRKDAYSASEFCKNAKRSYLSSDFGKCCFVKPTIYPCPPFWFRVLWRATKFSLKGLL